MRLFLSMSSRLFHKLRECQLTKAHCLLICLPGGISNCSSTCCCSAHSNSCISSGSSFFSDRTGMRGSVSAHRLRTGSLCGNNWRSRSGGYRARCGAWIRTWYGACAWCWICFVIFKKKWPGLPKLRSTKIVFRFAPPFRATAVQEKHYIKHLASTSTPGTRKMIGSTNSSFSIALALKKRTHY